MAYYRSGTQKPLEAGNGIDITDETISLKQASSSQFGGAKIDGTSITVNSNGQIKKLKTQTVTLSANTSQVYVGSTDTITAVASAGGTLSATSSNASIATVSVSNGEVTITGVAVGSCVITVTAAAVGEYGVGTATIDTTVSAAIYGVEWDGSSSPAWTRTDDAVGFADPNPYYSGMSGTPSSPFDNIMPWSGMRIVEDASAGTLVEIPKFYYKWTRNGTAMKLQISMIHEDGFLCSPAHADRSDGVGERDYAYVGRYHCASNYKSTTGVPSKVSIDRATFRSNIHNLGSYIQQNDFAIQQTIRMLYLVEFANQNSQAMIGYGIGSRYDNMGYTDNMPYHTGTTQSSRTTYGSGTQYRYIEGLQENVYDQVDGIYGNGRTVYCIKSPNQFSDLYNGINVGTGNGYIGYITAQTNSNINGYQQALYPSNTKKYLDGSTYICDLFSYYSSNQGIYTGGSGDYQTQEIGLFSIYQHPYANALENLGSRLMVLPPSRLSPPEP